MCGTTSDGGGRRSGSAKTVETLRRKYRRNRRRNDARRESEPDRRHVAELLGGRTRRRRLHGTDRRGGRRHDVSRRTAGHHPRRVRRRTGRRPHRPAAGGRRKDLFLHGSSDRNAPGGFVERRTRRRCRSRDRQRGQGIWGRRTARPRTEHHAQSAVRPELRILLRRSAAGRENRGGLCPGRTARRRGHLRQALCGQQPGDQPAGQRRSPERTGAAGDISPEFRNRRPGK